MSAFIFSVSLAGDWVLDHREDDILPIAYLEEQLREQYGQDILFIQESLSELECSITIDGDAERCKEQILKLVKERYDLEDDSIITVEWHPLEDDDGFVELRMDDGEENAESEQPHDRWMQALLDVLRENDQLENGPAGEGESDGEGNGEIGGESNSDGNGEDKDNNATERCMEKILSLVGAEEFKALAKELVQIAPQIVENNTPDILFHQSYLFSINGGHGLSTYLSLLSELLASLKVKGSSSSCEVKEIKITNGPAEGQSPFKDALSALHSKNMGEKIRVLCLDISEWMSMTGEQTFKDFLLEVASNSSNTVVVFRVPFVEKTVLKSIQRSLCDIVSVRTVSFPPFSNKEIVQCADTEFDRYGFRVAKNAWEGFHERIALEKSDGSFYGIRTIRKVVRELLYKKQLANARRGKKDLRISKRDMQLTVRKEEPSGEEMLDQLVGSEALKARIMEIVAQIEYSKKLGDMQPSCIHMRFVGGPGTGKTTVARIIGKILKERGLLRVGNFYEHSGRDFCGRYIGETAPKTSRLCREAYGSVLFIDEAYSLYRGSDNERDYGREALDTLIAEMENHRDDLVVIMAGYTKDMERLMEGNAGLASRMPYVIDFPNFERDQLYDIFVSMMENRFSYEKDMLDEVKSYFGAIPDEMISAKEFSNARFVRNLFERTFSKAALRCRTENKGSVVLTKEDFIRSSADKEFSFATHKKSTIGFIR